MTSLYFKIKSDIDADNERIIELFFRDWVDSTCNNEVHYDVDDIPVIAFNNVGKAHFYRRVRVDFEKQEDAVALVLKGVPPEFTNHLELSIDNPIPIQ